jgi:hypothetical protein
MARTPLEQDYRIAPTWYYVQGAYRGQLSLYWGAAFVRAEWHCIHRHRTRMEASACAFSFLLDVQDGKEPWRRSGART